MSKAKVIILALVLSVISLTIMNSLAKQLADSKAALWANRLKHMATEKALADCQKGDKD